MEHRFLLPELVGLVGEYIGPAFVFYQRGWPEALGVSDGAPSADAVRCFAYDSINIPSNVSVLIRDPSIKSIPINDLCMTETKEVGELLYMNTNRFDDPAQYTLRPIGMVGHIARAARLINNADVLSHVVMRCIKNGEDVKHLLRSLVSRLLVQTIEPDGKVYIVCRRLQGEIFEPLLLDIVDKIGDISVARFIIDSETRYNDMPRLRAKLY